MEINFKQSNPENFLKGRSLPIQFLVIHYTSNKGDTAKNNADYFARDPVGVSAHYFVDETSVWQSVKDTDTAYHCGGGRQSNKGGSFYGKCKNSNSIGIEMCLNNPCGNVRQGTIDLAIQLTRELMQKYNIPVDRVIRHHDVTGKYCPGPMVDDISLWNRFKAALKEEAEVKKTLILEIDGKQYPVEAIESEGSNYVKLRSFEQAGYQVGYDPEERLPSITAPKCRSEVKTTPEAEEAARVVQEACGLDDNTMSYMWRYLYGNELICKLAESIKKGGEQ